jgi:hypothetical protein
MTLPQAPLPQATSRDTRDARLYSLLHRGNDGDVEFYLQQCRNAHEVLELGVGFGRVASRLVAAGIPVTGLDNHAGLLALAVAEVAGLAAAARFEARFGDMRSFELGRKFDRIVIPYSGLFCLLDAAGVHACLTRCREHLTPEGRLLFDVYESDSFHDTCEPNDFDEVEREPVVELTDGAVRLAVFEHSSWDKTAQRLDITYEYFDRHRKLAHTCVVRQRYWVLQQFAPTLAEAGFQLESLRGGFANEPPGPDAAVIVVAARPG